MSDLISRQAAIDALDEYFVRIGKLKRRGLNNGEKAISLDTVGVIKALQTVQPEQCEDAVSRKTILKFLDDWMSALEDNVHNQSASDLKIIKKDFENLPSAEPKRGMWIEDKGQQRLMQNFIEKGEVWRVCSVCGAGHMIGHKYAIDKAYHDRHHNFCPNCGADMRTAEQIVHDAIDNTPMAEDAYPGIKERLHKAVDDMREVTNGN